jgi:hypothetical protein
MPRVRNDAATSNPMKLAPDYNCPPRPGCHGNYRAGVGERSQHVYMRLVRAWDIETNRLGSSRKQQLVERRATPVAKRDVACLHVDVRHGASQFKADRLVRVKIRWP